MTNALSNKQTIATSGATKIVADVGDGVGHHASKNITLTASCTFALPAGFPTPPHLTGSEVSKNTSTFGSGTVLSEVPAVAVAFVSAGVGHY